MADFMVPFNLPGDAEESVKVLGTKVAVLGILRRVYKTIWPDVLEDRHLHIHRRKNLKSVLRIACPRNGLKQGTLDCVTSLQTRT